MTDEPNPARPHLVQSDLGDEQVDPRVAAQSAVDPRVSMVLSVLAGRPVEGVAHEWDVEPSVLHRWVRDFLVAGSSVITHRPDPDEARQRDRFLAAFAHELRTPLAVARGWAMSLAEGGVPEEMVEQSIRRLSDALSRLSEHITDVEFSASVSLGRVRVAIEPVDIAGLCKELEGSPDLRTGGDLAVHADPRLLGLVLRDLWETAHREPAPDSVVIDVVEAGPWHEIRVVREGTPISPMILQALFDPFGTNDDTTGVTMGLYQARALIVAQGGILGAEGEDESTVLLARLPREPADGPGQGGPAGNGD